MFVWNCFSWRSGFLIIFLKLTILLGMKRDMLKWAYCNFITQILWVFLDKYCCQAFFFFIIWIKRMSFSFGRGGVLKNVLLSMLVYCLTVVTYFSIVEYIHGYLYQSSLYRWNLSQSTFNYRTRVEHLTLVDPIQFFLVS